MKILIVEDEKSLRELMQRTMEQERYVVETVADFDTAIEKIELYNYDCILLDIMLPGGTGFQILERIRQKVSDGPAPSVIIVSARDAVEDKIKGLELGADDYLAKPFHLSELSARMRSVFRRRFQQADPSIVVGNVRMQPDRFTVSINNRTLDLGRKEYDILHYFLNCPDRLVQKERLAEAVWGDNIDQTDNFDFIYAQIKNLRKKMAEAGADIEIKAVYGFGYRLQPVK